MEQGILNTENTQPPLISNIDAVVANTGYILTRNNANEVVVEEQPEQIQNLNTVQGNRRYHISRNNGNVEAEGYSSVQIPTPNTGDFFYAIRRQGNDFTLFRTPAVMEYIFSTNNLVANANFDVLGTRASRNVHVCNASGKVVKFGFLHTTAIRNSGLIDRAYRFEIIINDTNLPEFVLNFNNSTGSEIARTRDMENLNIFVEQGDSIGLRYVAVGGSNRGNYAQARIMVDINARNTNLNPTVIQ